jgi:hypothetical protein
MFLVSGLVLVGIPAFAVTVTGTYGCTSQVPGITNTITFAGESAVDPLGYATYTTPYFDQGTNPGCGADWLGLSGGQTTTITFSAPMDYFGLVWGSPDWYNSLELLDGATVLGTYTGSIVGGGHTYLNFFADPGEQFTEVVLSSSACCFESQNHSYQLASTSTPEPGTLGLLIPPILAGFRVRRSRRRA